MRYTFQDFKKLKTYKPKINFFQKTDSNLSFSSLEMSSHSRMYEIRKLKKIHSKKS